MTGNQAQPMEFGDNIKRLIERQRKEDSIMSSSDSPRKLINQLAYQQQRMDKHTNSDMKDDRRTESELVAIKLLNEDPFDAIDYSNNISVHDELNHLNSSS